MKRSLFFRIVPLCTLALLVFAAPATARQGHAGHDMSMPTAGLRAELIKDVDQLQDKYLGLAEAMTDHYAWRPGEGVRSVSEVFMHVANANLMIPSIAGVPMPDGMQMNDLQGRESLADPEAVQEALKESFDHVRHAIANVMDESLDDPVNLFGQDANKRQVLTLLVNHMHEHLGQSIAYARTNGVTPPWSAN